MDDDPRPLPEPLPRPAPRSPRRPRPAPGPLRRQAARALSWWRTERGTRRALVGSTVLVLLLLVALLGVVNHDTRPRAEAGDVLAGTTFTDDRLPHLGEVLLPWVRLEVGAGAPREELPALSGDEDQAPLRAPAGGRFVRVDVRFDDDDDEGGDYRIPLAAADSPYVEETDVVLRADGVEYPLTRDDGGGPLTLGPNASLQQGGTVWVAVQGVPRDLEVLVTVDGLTQVVDASDGSVEAGRAAELAQVPSSEELAEIEPLDCEDGRRLDRTDLVLDYPRRLPCQVSLVLRTAYVDGLGWAEDGREWLLVHVAAAPADVSLVTGKEPGSEYWESGRAVLSASLGGAPPVSEADVNDLSTGLLAVGDPDEPRQLIWDVPVGKTPSDLRLTTRVDAELGRPFVTDRQTLRYAWVVPGEELA